ncbi:MAG: anthranilate synthase component I, partial [Acidimicrobiales bacterium]
MSSTAEPDPAIAPGLALQPGLDRFRALAAAHAVVPVWTDVVADTLTPVAAFLNVVGDATGFLLESVEGGERWGRYSFVGRAPLATVVARGGEVTATGSLPVPDGGGRGILAALEALLERHRSPVLGDLPPLYAGVVGYLGYDVVREVERLPNVPPDDLGFPDAVLAVIGQLAVFDHWRQRVVLVDNVTVEPGWDDDAAAAAYRAAGRR